MPAHAIVVITGVNPNGVIIPGSNDFFGSLNLSGVVQVTTDFGNCSGALIGDFTVLTAGHCIGPSATGTPYNNPQVTFVGPTNNGPFTGGYDHMQVASATIDPLWNGDATLGGDLALLQLSQIAPAYAIRYSLYTGQALPVNSPLVLAGFGQSGTGASGASGTYDYGNLRAGTNEYATTGATFGWSSNLLIGQFYDGSNSSTNALSLATPYSSSAEVDTAHGDSGGPTFYNGQIIGVHDVGFCLGSSVCNTPPSVSGTNNSYYGQLFGDVSVAGSLAFIQSPEPASAVLIFLGLGLVGFGKLRSRRG
jgi:secreted trypsin-like serine protease